MGEGYPLGIVQEIKIWPYEQAVYAQPGIYPENETHKLEGFWDTNGSLNFGQTTRLSDSKKKEKKRTCQLVTFAVQADHGAKLKESEKKDNYLDLIREL